MIKSHRIRLGISSSFLIPVHVGEAIFRRETLNDIIQGTHSKTAVFIRNYFKAITWLFGSRNIDDNNLQVQNRRLSYQHITSSKAG